MQLIKKSLLITCLTLLLSNLASAQLTSSYIDIGEGPLAPKATVSFPLDKLLDGVTYIINCKITNPNPKMPEDPCLYSNYGFNSENGSYGNQTHLAPGQNWISIQLQGEPNRVLTFTNADQTAPLNIDLCYAVAK